MCRWKVALWGRVGYMVLFTIPDDILWADEDCLTFPGSVCLAASACVSPEDVSGVAAGWQFLILLSTVKLNETLTAKCDHWHFICI